MIFQRHHYRTCCSYCDLDVATIQHYAILGKYFFTLSNTAIYGTSPDKNQKYTYTQLTLRTKNISDTKVTDIEMLFFIWTMQLAIM